MAHATAPDITTLSSSTDDPGSPARRAPARERWSWALYDFSNTIWSMNVTSLYFATWLIVDLGASSASTMWATSVSSLLMALSVPLLGAVSDARRRRKPWVVWFTVASCLATAAIGLYGERFVPLFGEAVIGGQARPASFHLNGMALLWIAVAYSIANYAYQAAQPFYNAMMTELVPPEEYGRLSGLGTGVGYAGTIAGVLLVAPFFNGHLPIFGAVSAKAMQWLHMIPGTSHEGRVSTFVPTALLFLLFSVPLFLWCRDHNPAPKGTPIRWREAFAELGKTISEARRHPGALTFIITSLIYQDAVGTIAAVLGIFAIKAIGFTQDSVNLVFTILPITAVAGSIVTGKIVDRIGPKRTLMLVLGSWVVLLAAMIVFPTKTAFWVIGALIGFASFGGVPTAERPMLLSLIPRADAGRFFSLMLLSARAASFAGPLVWGYTIDALEPRVGTRVAYDVGLGTVGVFFLVSMFLLRRVPDRFSATATA